MSGVAPLRGVVKAGVLSTGSGVGSVGCGVGMSWMLLTLAGAPAAPASGRPKLGAPTGSATDNKTYYDSEFMSAGSG